MKAKAVFLVLLFVGMVFAVSPVSAKTVQASGWTNGTAKIIQNTPLPATQNESCKGQVENVLIENWNSLNDVCMSHKGGLRIGYFYSGGSYYGVAGFPYSNDVHIVEGLCGGALCQYSADKDMLVTTESQTGYGYNVVVFLHVTIRIKQGGMDTFTFDGSNPDYEIKNNSGQFLSTPSFAVSDNGEWIVAELYDAGLALINTNTFSARQITTDGYLYGRGIDPSEELAVSNSGTSVALTGLNAGFHVVDVTPGCGQSLIGDLSRLPTTIECASSDLEIGNVFQNFYYGQTPRFLNNGQELEVTVHSRTEDARRVTFIQDGVTSTHKIPLLALGDSFTSGEGETDMNYYEAGTDDTFDTCHVSTRAYPFLIGRSLGIMDRDVKSVACAGATTKDIIGVDTTYWGQGNRLGDSGLKLSSSSKIDAQNSAIDNFLPGRTLQSDFIEHYSPEIVTVGVGGNDAGLMGKLSSCAMPGTCEWAQGDGLRETAGEIKRLFDTLVPFYKQLSAKSPSTHFYAVGYPDVINADGVCDPVTSLLLDHTERVFIEHSLEYLDQVIHAAATQAGFTYLDTEHSLDGKRLCDGLISLAMNGLRLGNDISVTSALPMLKVIGAGTFHPTPVGHALIADSILTEHPGLQQDAVCTLNCAVPDIEPPSYWDVQSGSNSRASYVTDMAKQVSDTTNQLVVELPEGALQSLSSVTVEVHSQPISLGTFITSETGSMNGRVTLPSDIEPGFHTLHLYGMNREGELVDLYQFIVVEQDGQVVSTTSNGDVTPTNSKASSDDSLGINGVLGAENVAAIGSKLRSTLANPIRYVERVVDGGALVWIIVIGGISTVSSGLCIILLLRKWVKPGS